MGVGGGGAMAFASKDRGLFGLGHEGQFGLVYVSVFLCCLCFVVWCVVVSFPKRCAASYIFTVHLWTGCFSLPVFGVCFSPFEGVWRSVPQFACMKCRLGVVWFLGL